MFGFQVAHQALVDSALEGIDETAQCADRSVAGFFSGSLSFF